MMHTTAVLLLLLSSSLAEESERSVFHGDHEYLVGLIPSTQVSDPITNQYGLPGVYQDLKLELAGGSFQCFYQHLQKDANLYLYFEVLKGSDKNINAEIIQPNGEALKSFQWTNEGNVEQIIPNDGIYTFCLDNRLSQFSNKIVSLYLHSYFEQHWEKMNLNLEESYKSASKLLHSFGVISGNVQKIKNFDKMEISQSIKDWYLINETNSYVQKISIFLCVLIVVVSFLQAMFVKKLFTLPVSGSRA